ncbi:MAG: D-alanyl-D-alanine carboxypeptidase [Proteobacteria bacterium]|nr:D-alanyl-D-alanine carboxypeptidase [Pseudomonadota bacterium]
MVSLRSLRVGLGIALVAAAGTHAAAAPELVIDVSTGQVIHAEEATRPWYPASTTKMMTAYVALRAVKQGLLSLDTPLVASSRAAAQPPSKIGIRPGQEITLDNALKILMVKSANDVAMVVAEGVGGSIDAFADAMNREAARLGMRESHFRNPHGFHQEGHVTSARDLATLGRALLIEFPEYRDYWGIGAVKLGNRVMKNTNGLIGRYPGAEGMKTGFVCASGFNLVGVANRGGRTLMAVVLGAGSGADRTLKTAQLLDKGFSSWGGGSGSLAALPGSGYNSAPNMRTEICRKGRQLYLGEDEDNGGAISMPQADSSSVYAMLNPVQASGARAVGGTGGGGRPVLGARADFIPIAVHLGRNPGSTEVARGAGNGALASRAATAFAAPPRQDAARQAPARQAPAPVPPDGEPATPAPARAAAVGAGAPLQLPGIISNAPANAIGLRAPAPGAIRAGVKSDAKSKAGAITPKATKTATKTDGKKASKSDAKKADTKATAKKTDSKKKKKQ